MKANKWLGRLLLVVVVAFAVYPQAARADSAYGDWTLVSQPSSSETYWGQNSVVSTSAEAIAITNVYSYRLIGATWQLYSVPAGSMAAKTILMRNQSILVDYTSWLTNSGSTYRQPAQLIKNGISGSIYYSSGYGAAYNSVTGSWDWARIADSRAVNFPSTRAATSAEAASKAPACGFLANGESFGYLGMVGAKDGVPDWIGAYATNGERGYVKAEDHQVPMPKDPADAVANFGTLRVKSIPVYESPCSETVVGYYDMYYGGTQDVLDLSNGRLVCSE